MCQSSRTRLEPPSVVRIDFAPTETSGRAAGSAALPELTKLLSELLTGGRPVAADAVT